MHVVAPVPILAASANKRCRMTDPSVATTSIPLFSAKATVSTQVCLVAVHV